MRRDAGAELPHDPKGVFNEIWELYRQVVRAERQRWDLKTDADPKTDALGRTKSRQERAAFKSSFKLCILVEDDAVDFRFDVINMLCVTSLRFA